MLICRSGLLVAGVKGLVLWSVPELRRIRTVSVTPCSQITAFPGGLIVNDCFRSNGRTKVRTTTLSQPSPRATHGRTHARTQTRTLMITHVHTSARAHSHACCPLPSGVDSGHRV